MAAPRSSAVAREEEQLAVRVERLHWGTTARSRLAWVLDRVVYADRLLEKGQEQERRVRVIVLFEWCGNEMQGRWGFRGKSIAWAMEPKGFASLVRQLRATAAQVAALTTVEQDAAPVVRHEFTGRVRLTLGRLEGRWFFEHTVTSTLPILATAALLTAIARIPPSLLRTCRRPGCGRVFVAKKTQRVCLAHREDVRLEQYRHAQAKRRAHLRAAKQKGRVAR
jgi:hypothetical protein